MPIGKYPERVGDFKKWANSKVLKGSITDRATRKGRRSRKTRRKKNGLQD